MIVQIESQRALDNLEEIAAVEGVDGVFIGPATSPPASAISGAKAMKTWWA